MCLLFVYINPSPSAGLFQVIIVNTRDELYDRPTNNAESLGTGSNIVAGTDQTPGKEGGTWLGAAQGGRVASLLNILTPKHLEKDPSTVKGRGSLVIDYLKGRDSARDYIHKIVKSGDDYSNFNFVAVEKKVEETLPQYEVVYVNYPEKEIHSSSESYQAFGNSHPSTPFKKCEEGKRMFEEIMAASGTMLKDKEKLLENFYEMMATTRQWLPDPILAEYGMGRPEQILESLSSINVCIPPIRYGSRTTSVIFVEHNGTVHYHEKTMQQPVDLKDVKWHHTYHKL